MKLLAIVQQLLKQPERKYLAMVGRIKTYLEQPEKNTLPASCTIHVPKFTLEGVKYLIEYTSHALRGGAGINLHLDNFKPNFQFDKEPGKIQFILHKDHPEYTPTTNFQSWKAPLFTTPEHLSSYPVSYVSDSMTEDNQIYYWDIAYGLTEGEPNNHKSIEHSIWEAYKAGLSGSYVAFDLSALRPQSVENSVGMVSSGAVSFGFMLARAYEFGQYQTMASLLAFLSSFNAVLRRGGQFKNGAITTSYPMWLPLAKDYLETPKEIYPWLKQGLVLPKDYQEFSDLLPLIYQKVNTGGLWLEKAVIQLTIGYQWLTSKSIFLDQRLRANVCREIQILDRATCNLSHLNAGQIRSFDQLPKALSYVTEFLCELHKAAPLDSSEYYLKASEDKQVGVGILGLANLLSLHDITYRDLVISLDRLITKVTPGLIYSVSQGYKELPPLTDFLPSYKRPDELSWWLIKAYSDAARVAYSYHMDRAFCIAPTANSSFRYEDYENWTTAPEISPPVLLEVERVSDTQEETDFFFYHPDTELAIQAGWLWYRNLVSTWQRLMNATGLAHSISFNIWEDIGPEFMVWFSDSEALTTYYRLDVDQSSLNKANQFSQDMRPIQCDCAG